MNIINRKLESKTMALCVPITIGLLWAGFMWWNDFWHLFSSGWFMSLTMVLGSFVAGSTSAGGGSVAFPAMAFVFEFPPQVARDFSLMIQSFGMGAASLVIFIRRIPVLMNVIIWGSLGGAAGIMFGFVAVAPFVPPTYTKVFFAALWLSFAFVLYLNGKNSEAIRFELITRKKRLDSAVLLVFGFIGGIISSLTGSGIDMFLFSLLTLYFCVCEKVATPTSVVLMGVNSILGFIGKGIFLDGMSAMAYDFLYVCIPVVIFGAPLGAIFIKERSRAFTRLFLCAVILIQFATAVAFVRLEPKHWWFAAATLGSGLILFSVLGVRGMRRQETDTVLPGDLNLVEATASGRKSFRRRKNKRFYSGNSSAGA